MGASYSNIRCSKRKINTLLRQVIYFLFISLISFQKHNIFSRFFPCRLCLCGQPETWCTILYLLNQRISYGKLSFIDYEPEWFLRPLNIHSCWFPSCRFRMLVSFSWCWWFFMLFVLYWQGYLYLESRNNRKKQKKIWYFFHF